MKQSAERFDNQTSVCNKERSLLSNDLFDQVREIGSRLGNRFASRSSVQNLDASLNQGTDGLVGLAVELLKSDMIGRQGADLVDDRPGEVGKGHLDIGSWLILGCGTLFNFSLLFAFHVV